MDDDIPVGEERSILAAELVLGLLEGEDLTLALRELSLDLGFAAEVECWRQLTSPLFEEFPEVSVPETVWNKAVERVEMSISVKNRFDLKHLRLRVRVWRFVAVSAGLAAAFLALFVVTRDFRDRPDPIAHTVVAAASLNGADPRKRATIVYEPRAAVLRVATEGFLSDKRAPELWAIPANGPPKSLGLVRGTGVTELAVPPALTPIIKSGVKFAISLENVEGAPHRQPSSAPVVSGQLSPI